MCEMILNLYKMIEWIDCKIKLRQICCHEKDKLDSMESKL